METLHTYPTSGIHAYTDGSAFAGFGVHLINSQMELLLISVLLAVIMFKLWSREHGHDNCSQNNSLTF